MAYVTNGHERQKLDLYLPIASEQPAPLIIWIHGGAFKMGSKEGIEFDPVPLEYLSLGFAIASLNYRLSQHAVFPAQTQDCKAAVRWLRAHAAQFNLNPEKFGAWGPSAGGHLSAMLGVTGHVAALDVGEHLNQSSRVQCVVDYFGPTDFLQMDAQRLPTGMIHDNADSPESELIGGAIQQHKEATARANPISYVTRDAAQTAPPFLIVHGDADPLVPYGQSVIFAEALHTANVPTTFYTVRGGGHGRFTDPVVPEMTRGFLKRHLL
jgi:acetyl esterase/lipase